LIEIGIPSADSSDPVLTHENSRVSIAAGRMKLGVGIGGVNQHIGVDDKH